MTVIQGSLIVVALAIILGLSGYAITLWRKVFAQQRQQQASAAQRRDTLLEQVQHITKAAVAEQCQPAEAALRLVNLLRAIPNVNAEQLAQQLPHLHAMYAAISEQPILAERKALPKLERRRLDRELERQQTELGPAMLTEITEKLLDETQFAQWLQQ
ncbi:DUF2489 domain-containing protein [Ferrimonas senticii]|uniref:DUF2489 domain-containing protein n=1 Tax=Ferrimonas senticii TaxID=394566 RepID=UPI0003F9B022|nr:DUF2489 domain-containing protein [Ferrimonas senticii]